MVKSLAWFVIGALVGGAFVWLRLAGSPGESMSGAEALSSRRASEGTASAERLAMELSQERERRVELSRQLAELEEELVATMELEQAVDTAEGTAASTGPPAGDGSDEPWFDPESLEALGYPPGEIDHIKEVFEDSVMHRLELADARTRNDEKGMSPVIRDRLLVRQRAREELGDDGFDALLYASGEKNRVIVSALVPGSPGAVAGLQPGDVVISYAETRVFVPQELKKLTTEGERGAVTEIRVHRNGEERRVFLPRGPIGVKLDFESHAPVLD